VSIQGHNEFGANVTSNFTKDKIE